MDKSVELVSMAERGSARGSTAPRTTCSSVAEAAAAVRSSFAHQPKCWATHEELADEVAEDALQGGVDPKKAQSIVQCTTRFATLMCVIIVFLKVGVYLYSGAALVRTSALDSIGDLIANMITLTTSQQMRNIDVEKYPVGQGHFEPIGVIVFSTLMASAMQVNALENIQELLQDQEKSREEAVHGFMDALFAMDHDRNDAENTHFFSNVSVGFDAFRTVKDHLDDHTIGMQAPAMQSLMSSTSLTDARKALSNEINWAADVESWSARWSTTIKTSFFLSCCIVYKFSLWMFCLLYAIPKTGSTLLVALAADKRNDFMASSFAVMAMTSALLLEDRIGEEATEKIDPAASLLYSSFIIYTWVCMIISSARVLSKQSVPQMVSALEEAVPAMLCNTPCSANSVKCYTTSHKHTVEIDLAVNDPNTSYAQVAQAIGLLTAEVQKMEDIERVLVTTS